MADSGKGAKGLWLSVPQWLRELLRDAGIALALVGTVLLALYLILGVWPPMVVVETGSMEHDSSRSSVGVIDTGDLVFIADVDSASEVTSYVEGRATGESTFGDYGDVIVYRKWGSEAYTPVIHRAMAYVEWDPVDRTYSVAHLSELTDGQDYVIDGFGTPSAMNGSRLILLDVGFRHINVTIDFNILESPANNPHSGFITMGDYNSPSVDQHGGIINETVRASWVIGKGEVELPWFGLLKLTLQNYPAGRGLPDAAGNSWWSLCIALAVIVAVPFLLDLAFSEASAYIKKRREAKKGGGAEAVVGEAEGAASAGAAADGKLSIGGWNKDAPQEGAQETSLPQKEDDRP